MMDPGDDRLADRLRGGDVAAFEEAFRAYSDGLIRFALAHLRDEMEAEDVVHEVFLQVWRLRDRLPGGASLRVYLLTAVRNRSINAARRSARLNPPAGAGSAAVRLEQLPARESGSDAVEIAELDAAIRKAVADLPERCRTAFLLCRDQGLSYAEAAEVMDVSPGTVHTQIKRALQSLRAALQPFVAFVLSLLPLLS